MGQKAALAKRQLGGGKNMLPLKRPKTTVFLCALLTAAAFILPFVLRRGGVLYIAHDQITQQLPFMQEIVRAVRAGEFIYNFNIDLGSGFIEAFSFYNLASVFTLPLFFMPASWVPYTLAPMLMLKFAFAGLFAYMYIRRHTKGDYAAVIGGMLYSFSGFAIGNMVFHFADLIALFPLLLYGLDAVMMEEKTGIFALAVGVCGLANPMLFVPAALFTVLVFFVKLLCKTYKLTPRRFARLAGETICGLCLAAVILVPFYTSVLANPRTSAPLLFGAKWFVYVAYRYFEIVRGLILPPEVMHANSMMLLVDAVSPELYLPFFGLILAFAWALRAGGRKRSDWVFWLMISCLVFMLVPILNSLFNAVNVVYYSRWMFGVSLITSLASAKVLEDETVQIKRGLILWGIFAAVFAGCLALWKFYYKQPQIITYLPLFFVNLGLVIFGLLGAVVLRKLQKKPAIILCCVAMCAVLTGGFNILFNQAVDSNYPAVSHFAAEEIKSLPEGAYRVVTPISNLYFGHGSPISFTSTVPASVFELQEAFGRNRTSSSRILAEEKGLWALLGVRFEATMSAEKPQFENANLYKQGEHFTIWENLDALPLVQGHTQYILEEEALPLENVQKSIVMLQALVIKEVNAKEFNLLQKAGQNAFAQLSYEDAVAQRKAIAASEVVMGKAEIYAKINMKQGGAALIALPFEKNWKCEVNGEIVPIYKADFGLMAVPLQAGENEIMLRYMPVGGAVPLMLSCAALLFIAALIILGFKKLKQGKLIK